MKPEEIERASMSIIQEELDRMGAILPEENVSIVKRVIHTTADFDYVANLRFTPGAAEAGTAALRRGIPIITDTNMARAGVNRPTLEQLGGSVLCFMADPDVAKTAREKGITRAVASMRKVARDCPGVILAVGNAPAALRVENGQAVVTIVWGSSNYDYMRLGEEKLLPMNTESNSTFEVHVSVFDRKLTVYGDTTAMSTPWNCSTPTNSPWTAARTAIR